MLGSSLTSEAQSSLVPSIIELVACLVDPDGGVPAELLVICCELPLTCYAIVPPAPERVPYAVLSTFEAWVPIIIQTRGDDAAEVSF